jgi:putative transposase
MANTYTQLHIQFVFAVKYRAAVIQKSWKESLHRYMTGIIQNKHKVLQINSVYDHMHLLIGMRPTESIASMMQHVKAESSKWITSQRFSPHRFAWQDGYGAFSYSKTNLGDVIRYIQNQEAHHKKETFLEEYRRFLTAFGTDWEEQYIFKELE